MRSLQRQALVHTLPAARSRRIARVPQCCCDSLLFARMAHFLLRCSLFHCALSRAPRPLACHERPRVHRHNKNRHGAPQRARGHNQGGALAALWCSRSLVCARVVGERLLIYAEMSWRKCFLMKRLGSLFLRRGRLWSSSLPMRQTTVTPIAFIQQLLIKILKSSSCRKTPLLVNDESDVVTAATNFTSERCAYHISHVPITHAGRMSCPLDPNIVALLRRI